MKRSILVVLGTSVLFWLIFIGFDYLAQVQKYKFSIFSPDRTIFGWSEAIVLYYMCHGSLLECSVHCSYVMTGSPCSRHLSISPLPYFLFMPRCICQFLCEATLIFHRSPLFSYSYCSQVSHSYAGSLSASEKTISIKLKVARRR